MLTKISKLLREYLILGLLTVAPLALTIFVLMWLLSIVDNFMPDSLKFFPGIGVLFCIAILLIAGILTKTVGGNLFTSISEGILNHLPIVRSIYSILKQVSNALFSNSAKSGFKRVVSVKLLGDCRVLAFVTGEHTETGELLVFIPTAPNPTSGYTAFFTKDKVEKSNFTVEEALKIIVSCGSAISPTIKKELKP